MARPLASARAAEYISISLARRTDLSCHHTSDDVLSVDRDKPFMFLYRYGREIHIDILRAYRVCCILTLCAELICACERRHQERISHAEPSAR
jgi:hypothetical protein